MGLTVPYDGEYQDVEKMTTRALQAAKKEFKTALSTYGPAEARYYEEKIDIVDEEQWARRNG